MLTMPELHDLNEKLDNLNSRLAEVRTDVAVMRANLLGMDGKSGLIQEVYCLKENQKTIMSMKDRLIGGAAIVGGIVGAIMTAAAKAIATIIVK